MPSPRFCTQCTGPLELRHLDDERWPQPVCPRCGHIEWQNPKPTVAVLITRDAPGGTQVLLARRCIEPYKGCWDCPGGFIDPDEHPEAALRRECREELAVEIDIRRLVGIFMDRYGDGGEHTLNIYYEAAINSGHLTPGSDVSEIGWFPLDAVPEPLAFANNGEAIRALAASRGR